MNPGRYYLPMMNYYNGNLINRLFNGLKTFKWKELLNGANKTINVVNQTIPLIRQAKPMINNIKSVISLTKAFNNETAPKKNLKTKIPIAKENNNPTFFI